MVNNLRKLVHWRLATLCHNKDELRHPPPWFRLWAGTVRVQTVVYKLSKQFILFRTTCSSNYCLICFWWTERHKTISTERFSLVKFLDLGHVNQKWEMSRPVLIWLHTESRKQWNRQLRHVHTVEACRFIRQMAAVLQRTTTRVHLAREYALCLFFLFHIITKNLRCIWDNEEDR